MTLSTFVEPFFTGGSTNTTVPEPFPVSINGHGYIIEPTECHRQFINQMRPVGPQSDEPGEAMLNPENLWKRSASSWHHGAGQVWFDSSKEADRERFRQSKGMDVWTPFQLSLLPEANTQKLTATGTNLRLFNDPTNGKLWVVDGGNVKVTSNPSAASPTWTTCTGLPGGTITGATFTGAHLYVSVAGVLYRCAVTSTVFASWYSGTNTDGAAYANGRLLAWNNTTGEVFELSAAATKTTIFTHPQGAAFDYDDIIGAPNATYIAGHVGYTAEIYRTDVKDATGALSVPILSASILNERVTRMCWEAGYVILATQQNDGVGRIRMAQIQNPLYVTGGSLLVGPDMFSQLGQRPTGAINALAPNGRFLYFSWANLDGVSTGAGRLDLSTLTQPGVPAYATDQMAGEAGAAVQGAVLDIVADAGSGQLWLAVSGAGIYGTTNAASSFMAGAYLDTGRIRFGLLDPKVFSQIDLRCAPTTGTTIKLTTTSDDGTVGAPLIYDDSGTGPAQPLTLDQLVGEWIDVRIELVDSGTVTPVLLWWVLKAIPVPGALQQIIVAVILRDQVAAHPGDQAPTIPFDVEAEIQFLNSLVASRQIVPYQTGFELRQVYVNNLEEIPDKLVLGNRHFEGLVKVELKTLT